MILIIHTFLQDGAWCWLSFLRIILGPTVQALCALRGEMSVLFVLKNLRCGAAPDFCLIL